MYQELNQQIQNLNPNAQLNNLFPQSPESINSSLPPADNFLNNLNDPNQIVSITQELNNYKDQNIADTNITSQSNNLHSSMKYYILKVIVIVIIYLIFSTDTIKSFAGKYIVLIAPNNGNNISLIGLIIYGILIAVAIVVADKFLYKYLPY